MDKYTQQTALECNVVTSPSDRPVLCQRLSRRPHIQVDNKPAEEKFVTSNNRIETYKMGDDLRDLNLSVKKLAEADKKFLDEVKARNLEAYIYSGVPGSLFHHVPLIRGLGADPSDAVYAGTVASKDTTVYFPKGDASSLVWLEETDFANNPILANGVIHHTAGGSVTTKDMPLGRGVAILSETKNAIKNSLFADDGTDIYNWFTTAGNGITRRDSIGWMGVPSLWIWGAEVWNSDTFDISSLVDGDNIAISFGWRTDGAARVRIFYTNGIHNASENIVIEEGCGYMQYKATIPANIGGVGGTCKIYLELISGTFVSICAPQAALGFTVSGGKAEYPAFIGGLGDGVQGEITAQSMKVTGEWQAGMWRRVGTKVSDSFICVSGYVQPLAENYRISDGGRIFVFEDSRSDKETSCYLFSSGADLKIFTRSDGVVYDDVIITGFSKGDVLFVALYVGWTDGAVHMGCKVRIVGGTTTFTAEDTTTNDKFTLYDTLWIGCSENENLQADAIFQDVNVWAGTEQMISDQVAYMANTDNLMEHRETLGRLYKLYPNLSPSPWERGRYDGPIFCENVEAL